MRHPGKVKQACLKEVSALELPFWYLDPKGMTVDSVWRGGTEAMHNQAVKTGSAFMSGSEIGRMKKRRRIGPLLQSASIVKRAKIKEAALDPETGELRKDLYINQDLGNELGIRGAKKKRGAAIAAQEGGKTLGQETKPKTKGVQHRTPKGTKPSDPKKKAHAEFFKEPGRTKAVLPKVSLQHDPFGSALNVADFISKGDPNASLSDYMKSRDRYTRKKAHAIHSHLTGQATDWAAEKLGDIHPYMGEMAKKFGKQVAGRHERGKFTDISGTQIPLEKKVKDASGKEVVQKATVNLSDLEKAKTQPAAQKFEPEMVHGSDPEKLQRKKLRDVVADKTSPLQQTPEFKQASQSVQAQMPVYDKSQKKLVTPAPVAPEQGIAKISQTAATSPGAHHTMGRGEEAQTKLKKDKFTTPGAVGEDVASSVASRDFRAARGQLRNRNIMSKHRFKMGGLGLAAVAAGGGLYGLGNIVQGMAQARKEQLQGINMMNSDREYSIGATLLENYQTWKTRKRIYGPSGRKNNKWRFDPENKHHRKLALGMTDVKFAKFSGSKADLGKRSFVKTLKGIPLKYTFFSNDRKHQYGGKTIGMRQKIISLHKRLEKPLPRGFENYSFEQIGNYFKRRANKPEWQQHHTAKLPMVKRLKIHGQSLLKKVKNLVNKGKFEEAAEETKGNIIEVQDFTPPQTQVECSFLSEKVTTPMDCGCKDCAIVVNKIKESQDALRETSVTAFGQNLRGESEGRTRRYEFENKKHKEFKRRSKQHKRRARVNEDAEIEYVARPYREGLSGVIQKVSKLFYHPPRHTDD